MFSMPCRKKRNFVAAKASYHGHPRKARKSRKGHLVAGHLAVGRLAAGPLARGGAGLSARALPEKPKNHLAG
jgi:hypothetical protein